MRHLKFIGFAVLLLMSAVSARAELITGGSTVVDLTSLTALSNAGLTVQPLGTATLDTTRTPTTVTFPVTGGTSVSAGSTVNHQGTGMAITNNSNFLFLTNFVVDTQRAFMSGDTQSLDVFGRNYNSGGSAADLFTLQPTGAGRTYRLLFTNAASTALNSVAGASTGAGTQWTGTEFGIAHLNFQTGANGGGSGGSGGGGGPNPVPEPGTALLLSMGLLGLLGTALKRR